jgi:hypothetical protein
MIPLEGVSAMIVYICMRSWERRFVWRRLALMGLLENDFLDTVPFGNTAAV